MQGLQSGVSGSDGITPIYFNLNLLKHENAFLILHCISVLVILTDAIFSDYINILGKKLYIFDILTL